MGAQGFIAIVGWDEHHMRWYSKKEDGCGDHGSSMALFMLGYNSGERTVRQARWKISPPNSETTKS
jgi:hypothetical protein